MKRLDESTKKKLVIGIGCLLIIIFIGIFIYMRQSENYNYLKVNKSEYLVYTAKSNSGTYPKLIPYLNINTSVAEEVNKDIDDLLSSYIDSEMASISYEYDISGDMLSLVVKIVDYDTEFAPEIRFRSYNYNLKDGSLISDMDLLGLFEINESDVSNAIESQFEKYYEDMLEEEYYDERECNFECFLKYREVDNYLDDVAYYVENGKLVAFKPFVFYSIFGEENYFKEKDFKFTITK